MNYLNNLNKLLKMNNFNFEYQLEDLVYHINDFDYEKSNILFNLGGVLNHELYFKSMSYKNEAPSGTLKNEIEKKYRSIDNFFKEFKKSALELKGSGYTFLVINKYAQIEIINVKNQDLPQLQGYIPVFNIDMWEHAYYLNYKNNKSEYIDNFIDIADFKFANKLYNDIIKTKK